MTQADLDGWRSALRGRSDVVIKSYPAFNHLFMVGDGKATPSTGASITALAITVPATAVT